MPRDLTLVLSHTMLSVPALVLAVTQTLFQTWTHSCAVSLLPAQDSFELDPTNLDHAAQQSPQCTSKAQETVKPRVLACLGRKVMNENGRIHGHSSVEAPRGIIDPPTSIYMNDFPPSFLPSIPSFFPPIHRS